MDSKFSLILFYFFLLLFFFSCKKDKSPVIFSSVSSGTDFTLYSISKLNDDTIFACGGKDKKGIILRSINGGDTWHLLSDSFDQVIYDVYFINSNIGFAGGGTPDVFKTTDRGSTWEKLYIPFPDFPLSYRVPLRKIFFTNDSTGFICGGGKFSNGIIFKTNDKGQSWTLTLIEHELRSILFLNEFTGFACGFGAMVKTTDSGDNWNIISSPNEFYTSLTTSLNQLWTSGYNGGIYKASEVGNNWTISNSGNNAFSARTHFNCITAATTGTLIAAGNDGLISISHDNGNSWTEGESFNGITIKSFLLTSENSGIAVGNDGMIFKFSF